MAWFGGVSGSNSSGLYTAMSVTVEAVTPNVELSGFRFVPIQAAFCTLTLRSDGEDRILYAAEMAAVTTAVAFPPVRPKVGDVLVLSSSVPVQMRYRTTPASYGGLMGLGEWQEFPGYYSSWDLDLAQMAPLRSEMEPVYEQFHAGPVRVATSYVLSGQLDRWFTQSFLPIAETPLSTWMMQEVGYVKPAPPSGGGVLVPLSGRGWPMRGRAGGGGGAPAVAAWWTTDDPSSVPVGAQPGDFVLDVTDGKVYEVVS